MKMIPSYLNQNVKSNAERRVFQEFKKVNDGKGYYCLHSVNLPEHEYKICSEIDFIVLSQHGLFILEVKGGGITCNNDGIWFYEDRWGIRHHSSEGPFHQARSGMFTLRDRLNEKIPHHEMREMVMGFGVIFPDCSFSVEGMEWDNEMVLDTKQMSVSKIARYFDKLEDYWHKKMPDRACICSEELVSKVLQVIRPTFDMVQSLTIEAEEIDTRLVSLTENQSSRLDIIEHYPRILIEGGAGTGKTFLALEESRRQLSEKKKALLLCFSPLLASFLKSRNLSIGNTVLSIHELMLNSILEYGKIPAGYTPGMEITNPWFREILAPEFSKITTLIPEEKKFDVLIIDEGQDILNMNYLNGLDNILKGGFTSGNWRIFFDTNNQSAIYGGLDTEVLEFLKTLSPIIPKLTINCRNTDPIITQTKLFTGTDLATKSTGDGPIVEFDFYDTKKQAAELIDKFLRKLKNQGCNDSEITILSHQEWELSAASELIPKWKNNIRVLKGSQYDLFPFPGITFSTVADFKGLENRYIILIDIDDIDSSPISIATLYVGMTRARIKLMLLIDKKIESHLNEILLCNYKKITKEQFHE